VVQELRILSPCGILGYGFPEESFLRGIECEPHVIAVDARSTDAGPHKLGADVGIVSVRAAKRDLALLMTHAHELRIPLIIDSGGIGDTDVYGAQQHAPLMDVSIPTGGLSRTP